MTSKINQENRFYLDPDTQEHARLEHLERHATHAIYEAFLEASGRPEGGCFLSGFRLNLPAGACYDVVLSNNGASKPPGNLQNSPSTRLEIHGIEHYT